MIPGASLFPELEAAKLFRQLNKARRDAAEATERAKVAYQEAETSRANLTTLEEYVLRTQQTRTTNEHR